MLSEVFPEPDAHDMIMIVPSQVFDRVPASIGAEIINQDNFESGIHFIEGCLDTRAKFGQRFFAVINRYHY